ncbi:hypothetical protein C9I56_37125 [Paraburkholderia caribensis]|nr:hypothetical protein C9I56_37125 [Paraburkholderia caribensis]
MTKDRTKVGLLSHAVMSQPLCCPLQTAIRFFRRPLPASPTASLAGCLPTGQRYGLTMFRLKNTMG